MKGDHSRGVGRTKKKCIQKIGSCGRKDPDRGPLLGKGWGNQGKTPKLIASQNLPERKGEKGRRKKAAAAPDILPRRKEGETAEKKKVTNSKKPGFLGSKEGGRSGRPRKGRKHLHIG